MHQDQIASAGPAALAARLRGLRRQWSGVRVTQQMVAQALGGSTPLVSGWESTSNPSAPPDRRLFQYATLFATRRSLQDGQLRLLSEDDLTTKERAARDQLNQELLALRAEDAAPSEVEGPSGTWYFPDQGPIRLICGRLPEAHRGDYASPESYNYTEVHGYGDADAMVELFGHLRMLNPRSDVRFMLAENMLSDDLSAHVVLIGGLQWNRAARFYARTSGLPVRQVEDENVQDGEVFEIERDGRKRRFLPTFLEGDPMLGLIEDVGLFARMPNPSAPQRTLTICNGIYSRGVYGAVRTLTDAGVRDANESYLANRFAGTTEYGVLLRVPVLGGATSTPDLTSDYHRLFVWPPRDEAARKEPT